MINKFKKRKNFENSYEQNSNIRKFDVGIMGVWQGCNYGSIATYYALHQIIKSFGFSVLMINKPIVIENDFEQKMTHSRRFGEEHYHISEKYKLEDLSELNNYVDTFIMGSDQVWNRGISKHFGKAYYFDFVKKEKKKLAYAVSFGHDRDFAKIRDRILISSYMRRFDGISVRESHGVKICKYKYGVRATQVLDPIFVCEKEEFIALAEKSFAKSEIKNNEKFIATYILDPTPEKNSAIKWVKDKLGYKVINILDGVPHKFKENSKKMEGIGEIPKNVQVEDWLYYIQNCEFLVTDSCHGIGFGLIFERPFIGIANPNRGLSRFESLLEMVNLKERMVVNAENIIGNEELIKTIDYKPIKEILNREKKRSKEWLRNALFKPKK